MAATMTAAAVEGVLGLVFGGINFALERRGMAALTEADQLDYLASLEARSETAAGIGDKALREAIERYRQRRAQEAPPHGS